MQKESFRSDKKQFLSGTLNFDISFKIWGNLMGIWGNPGEIPHVGC